MKLNFYVHRELRAPSNPDRGYKLTISDPAHSYKYGDGYPLFTEKVSSLNDPPWDGFSIDMEIVPRLINYLQEMVDKSKLQE